MGTWVSRWFPPVGGKPSASQLAARPTLGFTGAGGGWPRLQHPPPPSPTPTSSSSDILRKFHPDISNGYFISIFIWISGCSTRLYFYHLEELKHPPSSFNLIRHPLEASTRYSVWIFHLNIWIFIQIDQYCLQFKCPV